LGLLGCQEAIIHKPATSNCPIDLLGLSASRDECNFKRFLHGKQGVYLYFIIP